MYSKVVHIIIPTGEHDRDRGKHLVPWFATMSEAQMRY